MELFVARQPIFDIKGNVYAYELLFRSSFKNQFDNHEENTATAKVISAAFYSPDGNDIAGGKPVFINFPRDLLLNESASILPPSIAVIEVLETVEPDEQIIAACKNLRERGYKIALDDFIYQDEPHPLAPFANFIKVDFRATTREQQKAIVKQYQGKLSLLAEKVETQEEFEEAARMGFSYFQGYFFARPVITKTRDVLGFKLNYLRILQLIQATNLDFNELAGIIKQEPSISYKLLRFVNSPLFALRCEIHSLDQALVILGERELRRWLSLIVLVDLSTDKPRELVVSASLRARFSELIARQTTMKHRSEDLFLLGLFSLLDAILSRPLSDLLRGLNLNEDIEATLLQKADRNQEISAIWDLVLAYEAADWQTAVARAKELNIDPAGVPELYRDAVQWSEQIYTK